ncbi:uncharacterized protein RJT20DRAFT_133053 [Scheffersomyces xylosifermentans]|uniref:uncharacterized protein n=1 Tax=Scheffersomyces xylosifermentans TaxID=1304137 RepID=UPI00315D4D42
MTNNRSSTTDSSVTEPEPVSETSLELEQRPEQGPVPPTESVPNNDVADNNRQASNYPEAAVRAIECDIVVSTTGRMNAYHSTCDDDVAYILNEFGKRYIDTDDELQPKRRATESTSILKSFSSSVERQYYGICGEFLKAHSPTSAKYFNDDMIFLHDSSIYVGNVQSKLQNYYFDMNNSNIGHFESALLKLEAMLLEREKQMKILIATNEETWMYIYNADNNPISECRALLKKLRTVFAAELQVQQRIKSPTKQPTKMPTLELTKNSANHTV